MFLKYYLRTLLPSLIAAALPVPVHALTIDRAEYADRLRAFWAGQCLANHTGLTTEFDRTSVPFYTDADWGIGDIDWVFQDPWKADDDTDIEYVYQYLMHLHDITTLSAVQIREGWKTHINNNIWISNENARWLIEDYNQVPPHTGMLQRSGTNPLMIDAQLTTEMFGLYAPGLPTKALEMADLPIATSADAFAYQAAQFHVAMHALAARVDPALTMKQKVLWILSETRKLFPDTSRIADIYDFVEAEYTSNPDKDDWEGTRDRVYDRYQLKAQEYGFTYRDQSESAINFSAGMVGLLYGEGDYGKTVRIGTLAGWDSDNPTATNGGFVAFLMGYDALNAAFPGRNFSDRYDASFSRDNLPDYLPGDPDATDTFTMMAARMLPVIDRAVQEAGGTVDLVNDIWVIPDIPALGLEANPRWQLRLRSANIGVVEAGGTVTATSTAGGDPSAIVDGFEHAFSGVEVDTDNIPRYSGSTVSNATVTVTYDRAVEVWMIRLIQGGLNGAAAGSFTSLQWEARVGGSWVVVSGSAPAVEAGWTMQQIDLVLDAPVQADAIRVSGPVAGGDLGVFELDAFARPITDRVWVLTSGLPNAVDGEEYSQSLQAGYTATPYTWSLSSGSLPHGLSLSPDGVISGTVAPGTTGDFAFAVEVIDSETPSTSATRELTLTVAPDESPTVDPGELGPAIANEPFIQQLAASGGNGQLEWRLAGGQLPPGLTLSLSGELAGVPRGVGRSRLIIEVTDQDGDMDTMETVIDVVIRTEFAWNSYDTVMQSGMPQAKVTDKGGSMTAELEFYESSDDAGVEFGTALPVHNPGLHTSAFNQLENYWSGLTNGYDYPYAGKSSTARGAGETNVPLPTGVYDLTLHPPNNDHLTVAAFVVPEDGDYSLDQIAFRRVIGEGTTAILRVFGPEGEPLSGFTPLTADNSQAWVQDAASYPLAGLISGDRIHFGVDRAGNFGWDATEVAWRIMLDRPDEDYEYPAWSEVAFVGDVEVPSLEETVWGEGANPDGDAFTNLVEFYFGLNPWVADFHVEYEITIDPDTGVQRLRFPADPNAADVLVEVQEWVDDDWVTFVTDPPIVDRQVIVDFPGYKASRIVRLKMTR